MTRFVSNVTPQRPSPLFPYAVSAVYEYVRDSILQFYTALSSGGAMALNSAAKRRA